MTYKLPTEVAKLLATKRYYVFYEDGTWRTLTGDEWGVEQLWKLNPAKTGWEGGEFLISVIEAAFDRCMINQITGAETAQRSAKE